MYIYNSNVANMKTMLDIVDQQGSNIFRWCLENHVLFNQLYAANNAKFGIVQDLALRGYPFGEKVIRLIFPDDVDIYISNSVTDTLHVNMIERFHINDLAKLPYYLKNVSSTEINRAIESIEIKAQLYEKEKNYLFPCLIAYINDASNINFANLLAITMAMESGTEKQKTVEQIFFESRRLVLERIVENFYDYRR